MTITATASLDARLHGQIEEAIAGIGTPAFPFDVRYQKRFAHGVDSGQVDDAYVATLTIAAASTTTLFLSGLASSIFEHDHTVGLARVKKLALKNLSATAGDKLIVKPGATNPWLAPFASVATSQLECPAGSILILSHSQDGWIVTASSADRLAIENPGSSAIQCDIEIAGATT